MTLIMRGENPVVIVGRQEFFTDYGKGSSCRLCAACSPARLALTPPPLPRHTHTARVPPTQVPSASTRRATPSPTRSSTAGTSSTHPCPASTRSTTPAAVRRRRGRSSSRKVRHHSSWARARKLLLTPRSFPPARSMPHDDVFAAGSVLSNLPGGWALGLVVVAAVAFCKLPRLPLLRRTHTHLSLIAPTCSHHLWRQECHQGSMSATQLSTVQRVISASGGGCGSSNCRCCFRWRQVREARGVLPHLSLVC